MPNPAAPPWLDRIGEALDGVYMFGGREKQSPFREYFNQSGTPYTIATPPPMYRNPLTDKARFTFRGGTDGCPS